MRRDASDSLSKDIKFTMIGDGFMRDIVVSVIDNWELIDFIDISHIYESYDSPTSLLALITVLRTADILIDPCPSGGVCTLIT